MILAGPQEPLCAGVVKTSLGVSDQLNHRHGHLSITSLTPRDIIGTPHIMKRERGVLAFGLRLVRLADEVAELVATGNAQLGVGAVQV